MTSELKRILFGAAIVVFALWVLAHAERWWRKRKEQEEDGKNDW